MVFYQSAQRIPKNLNKLDNFSMNRVGLCWKVVYLTYYSKEVSIIILIKNIVVGDIIM